MEKYFTTLWKLYATACALMKFWAGLQKEGDEELLIKGVDAMLKIAVQLLSKPRPATVQTNLLQDTPGMMMKGKTRRSK